MWIWRDGPVILVVLFNREWLYLIGYAEDLMLYKMALSSELKDQYSQHGSHSTYLLTQSQSLPPHHQQQIQK